MPSNPHRPEIRGSALVKRALAVLGLIGAALAGIGLGRSPFRSAPPGEHVLHEITFDFATRQPIVPVRVNGAAPVPFVVDTGASVHVVDSTVAPPSAAQGDRVAMSGGGEASVPVRFAAPLTFETGGVVWNAQRAAIASLGYPDRKHFGGLIGAPILMRYVVRFDFPRRRLQLIEPGTYAAPSGAERVPFELQEDLPIVRATVDVGTGPLAARLLVDTGASQFVDLNRPFVESNRLLDAVQDAAPIERPAALGGGAPFLYGTARRVMLGVLVFDRPRVGFSRAQTGSSSRTERDGIIGNDLLRQFVVTVDYRRRVLVLETAPAAAR
jgi:aspartyl protease